MLDYFQEGCIELHSSCDDGKGIILINAETMKPECSVQEHEAPNTATHHATEERILGAIPNLTCSPGTKR